jgi:hypothetical protein
MVCSHCGSSKHRINHCDKFTAAHHNALVLAIAAGAAEGALVVAVTTALPAVAATLTAALAAKKLYDFYQGNAKMKAAKTKTEREAIAKETILNVLLEKFE